MQARRRGHHARSPLPQAAFPESRGLADLGRGEERLRLTRGDPRGTRAGVVARLGLKRDRWPQATSKNSDGTFCRDDRWLVEWATMRALRASLFAAHFVLLLAPGFARAAAYDELGTL